jgi:hypothetical protein
MIPLWLNTPQMEIFLFVKSFMERSSITRPVCCYIKVFLIYIYCKYDIKYIFVNLLLMFCSLEVL